MDYLETDCSHAYDYVDIHGRPIEVLIADDGQLFVNLQQIQSAGFNIFKKSQFMNAFLTRDIQIRHFENFLLSQGRKYILENKQNFDEEEVLGVFERVRAKLQSSGSTPHFGEGRIVNNSGSKNFTITTNNDLMNASGSSKGLPDNFQSTFSHMQPRGQNTVNGVPGTKFEKNDRRKNDNFGKEHMEMRRPKSMPNEKPDNRAKGRNMKFNGNTNVNEEPEVSWEGEISVPKVAPQTDQLSASSDRKPLGIERMELKPNNGYKVKVSHVEKNTLFFAQWNENQNLIEEILLQLNTNDLNLPVIANPVRGTLCIALFQEVWYRAVVHKNDACDVFVEFVDYGNKEHISTPVREMSEEMKKIPGQAIRMAVDQFTENFEPEVDQIIEVIVKKHIGEQYVDLTHLVVIKGVVKEVPIDQDPQVSTGPSSGAVTPIEKIDHPKPNIPADPNPAEECFTEIKQFNGELHNGKMVQIVNYTDDRFILRNKDAADICRRIYAHLTTMTKNSISNPKVGQLVLCAKDGMEGVHRAVIKKIDGAAAEVEYIDYYDTETVTLKSLRNVDKELASEPTGVIISPVYQPLLNVTDRSSIYLVNLVISKTKLKVILDGSKFDLQLSEDDKTVILSEKLALLENPKVDAEKPVESKPDEITEVKVPAAIESNSVAESADNFIEISMADMLYVTPEKGLGIYSCWNCQGGTVTLTSVSDDNIENIEKLCNIQPTDEQPYSADDGYMCLAKSSSSGREDEWYRGAVGEVSEDKKTFKILSVDYGYVEDIPVSNIRRFPKELMQIPIQGINANIMGIPNNPKIHEKLKELLADASVLDVNIKEDMDKDTFSYSVEIPDVYAELKTAGLM